MKNIFYQAPFITKVKSLWIILLALLLTSASCTKEEPKHRDVFRCEINGVPWEAGCDSQNLVWSCDYLDCQYYDDIGGIEVKANNVNSDDGISFYKSSDLKIGENFLDEAIYGITIDGLGKTYKSKNKGKVHIEEINISLKIIVASFEFVAYYNETDSVVVTSGSFKVKYRP